MEGIHATVEKIEQIKEITSGRFSRAEGMDETVILRADVDRADYCEIADIDMKTVNMLGSFYGILEYFEKGGQFVLKCETYLKRGEDEYMEERLSVEYFDCRDFLGLFSNEEKADSSLENFFNDSIGNIVRKLKETYPEVYSYIEHETISNIRDYDLDDSDKEYFAESYIEDNPVSSVEMAENYLCDDDKKRFICDWVDSL